MCKSDAEIDQIINTSYLNVAMISAYFDFDDYDQPIKKYLTDLEGLTLTNTISNLLEVKIQQNEAFLSDSLIFPGSYDSLKFYSISNSKNRIINPALIRNALCSGIINLDRRHEEYERTVYSFFDMFGYIGGLFDALAFGGFLFWDFFNEKIFSHYVLASLYQVKNESYSKDFRSFSDKKEDAKVFPKQKASQLDKYISEDEKENNSEVLSKQSQSLGNQRVSKVNRSI